ncbi:MFS transporter [Aureimonas fodinaquatilis]|uniref:MFS transporter n=1 Tax=Aureimonas fodinaquatilis TaxID=2565783 RepID=UPI00165E7047|nr:MFS transporter [Aureimonas fodinaquatilis]
MKARLSRIGISAIPDNPEILSAALEPRKRNFILFAVAQFVSFAGTWMQKAAVGWLIWELTHSPGWVGAIALSDLIAALWVAPLAGAVTDRSNPYRLIQLTQFLALSNTLLLMALVFSGGVTPWLLLVWAIIDATIQGFNQPVRMLITGTLAPRGLLNQAIASNSIAANLARIGGPALAGILMLKSGIESVLLLNAISFIAMFGIIWHLRIWIDQPRAGGAHRSLFADMQAGFSYIRNTREIAMLFVFALSFSLLGRPFIELFPAIAGETFQGGPGMLASLMSAQGVGALVGATCMLTPWRRNVLIAITYCAGISVCLSLIYFSTTTNPYFALPAIAFAGMFHVVCNIGMQSMAQTMSEMAMRGRVLALYWMVFRAVPALGAFTIGLAAHWFNLQVLIGLAACVFIVFTLIKLPLVRQVYFNKPMASGKD